MKQVMILQGISGSGKSTFARSLSGATVCSADDLFMVNGEYLFKPGLLGEAHARCFAKFLDALRRGDELVVVDNTNVEAWQIAPYMLATDAQNMVSPFNDRSQYRAKIVTFDVPMSVAIERNVHGVPPGVIAQQVRSLRSGWFLATPPFWQIEKAETVSR